MTPTGSLHIGPLALVYEAASGMPMPVAMGAYTAFYHDGAFEPSMPAHCTLPVTVSCESTDLPPGKPDFESGRNWKLYRTRDELLFAAGYTGRPRPDRVCRVNPQLTHCRIAMDSDTLNKKPLPAHVTFPLAYPIDQILAWGMLSRIRGALLHAALVVCKDGKGLLLAGRSGAGKSTISNFCADAGWTVLNDDRALVYFDGETVMVAGTPWHGSGKYAVPRTVPLTGILFLVHANTHALVSMNRTFRIRNLLQVTSVPWFEDSWSEPTLKTLESLADAVPIRELHFQRDPSVVSAIQRISQL